MGLTPPPGRTVQARAQRHAHHLGKVLRRHRISPAPRRGLCSWREFVRQHADQILATDFFTTDTVWLKSLYVLSFIEIGSRRIEFPGSPPTPPASR